MAPSAPTAAPPGIGRGLEWVVLTAIMGFVVSLISIEMFEPDTLGQQAIPASITAGSSAETTDAYSPNPINIDIDDMVMWTNDDSVVHTVTSGSGATSDGEFDSGIMTPGDTFLHTFETAGSFPYFCSLHPNMVGTVNVASGDPTFDPEFEADKAFYEENDSVVITIRDPDANTETNSVDELEDIHVFSDSDAVGAEFDAVETGPNTGIFVLEFDTTSAAAAGKILVSNGDTVTIEYTDNFPEQGGAREFTFQIGIGFSPLSITVDTDRESYETLEIIEIRGDVSAITGTVTTGKIDVSNVRLEDLVGNPVKYIRVGEPVVVAATVRNNEVTAQPILTIIEVRDSNGVPVFQAWQTGTLNGGGQSSVGLSWTPQAFDRYEIRILVSDSSSNQKPIANIVTLDSATGEVEIIDAGQGKQPVLLEILDPNGNRVLADQVRVETDGEFEYSAKLGSQLASVSGNYQVIVRYDQSNETASFAFATLEPQTWLQDLGGIATTSNSTIIDVNLYEDEGRLEILLSGPSGTKGFMHITVPTYLMNDVYRIDLNGRSYNNYRDFSNQLYTILELEYSHSTDRFDIFAHVPIEAETNSAAYIVKYEWEPCIEEQDICYIDRERQQAILILYFMHAHGMIPVTDVSYHGSIDNRVEIGGGATAIEEVREMVRIGDVSHSDSYPHPYPGQVFMTEADGRPENVRADIAVLVVPEFPIVQPIIIAAILIIIVLAMYRSKLKIR